MATRKRKQEFKTVEAQEREHAADILEREKKISDANVKKETWYEIQAGGKPGDKKIILKTRMSNGSVYKELYCNVKTLSSGKRVGFEQYNELLDLQKKGKIEMRQVVV